jgi:hypothetical protein
MDPDSLAEVHVAAALGKCGGWLTPSHMNAWHIDESI